MTRDEPEVLHVVFTEDGIPGWIGFEPRPGSEVIEITDIMWLAQHRRLPDGSWIVREVYQGTQAPEEQQEELHDQTMEEDSE